MTQNPGVIGTTTTRTTLININTASKEVLAVLVGTEYEDLPVKIVNYRNGSDGIPGTKDDKIFDSVDTIAAKSAAILNAGERIRIEEMVSAGYFKVLSSCFRIRSTGEVRNGRVKKTIEVVVKRADKGSDFLYYHEI